MGSELLLVIVIVVALAFDFTNGFHDTANAMATSIATGALKPRGRVVIVVNDRRELYPEILSRSGLTLEQSYQRHVNRRTGRRAGEYFETVLVARK